ncbi:MAG: alpha/beta hydrolase [Chlamydiae bacterium]|nr:alpha/beta hydrolase [Chlamydiota bacterium]
MIQISKISTPSLEYTASWTAFNSHLQSSFIEKVSDFFLYFFHRMAMRCLMPSSQIPKEILDYQKKIFSNWSHGLNFKSHLLHVKTPDGSLIHGYFLQQPHTLPSDPLVIFFQPNGGISTCKNFADVMEGSRTQNIRCNFIVFDSRGCGYSEGEATVAKDFILDGDSIYQFAKQYLKVPPHQIHCMGFSMGGAVAAQVKALHSDELGSLVIDRSFSTLKDAVLAHSVSRMHFTCRLISTIVIFLLNLLGWSTLDSEAALKKIRSRTLVIYHPKDGIICGNSQLSHHVSSFSNHITKLNLSRFRLVVDQGSDLHNLPLCSFQNKDGQSATQKVINFLDPTFV